MHTRRLEARALDHNVVKKKKKSEGFSWTHSSKHDDISNISISC